MTHVRLVETNDGRYGLQRRKLFLWCFCGYDGYIWDTASHIYEFATFDTLEKAQMRFDILINKIRLAKRKKPRVVRVIRTETI